MEIQNTLSVESGPRGTESRETFADQFKRIRDFTVELCNPLQIEDHVVQPVMDVSPPKWHLGHTTWFFEELVLSKYKHGYKVFNDDFAYIFNSYYESVGERVLRPNRGFMTRPTLKEVLAYRRYLDEEMMEFLTKEPDQSIVDIVVLGLNHEQQHQELLITDFKYILGHNPLFPAYMENTIPRSKIPGDGGESFEVEDGIYEIGYDGNGFCYDNELGRHKVYIHPFKAENRLVSNGEYLEFMDNGGYEDFRWWLSEGWDWVQRMETKAPMYWHFMDGKWNNYKLSGLEIVNPNEPVTHISMFEADAFAQWKRKRLLTEFEWEVLANQYADLSTSDGFVDNKLFHPAMKIGADNQLMGDAWEWTNSAYLPYPNFKKVEGAIGEYNGKFMINQMVLRGGSCATSMDHIRKTYRNFFHPHLRWQFTGIRLAESI